MILIDKSVNKIVSLNDTHFHGLDKNMPEKPRYEKLFSYGSIMTATKRMHAR